MHPLEHVKTDRWDACRLHNVIGLAYRWPLTLAIGVLPPPTASASQYRVWGEPGCIHNADKRIQSRTHKPLTFLRDDDLGPAIECAAKHCKFTTRAYSRARQTMVAGRSRPRKMRANR